MYSETLLIDPHQIHEEVRSSIISTNSPNPFYFLGAQSYKSCCLKYVFEVDVLISRSHPFQLKLNMVIFPSSPLILKPLFPRPQSLNHFYCDYGSYPEVPGPLSSQRGAGALGRNWP